MQLFKSFGDGIGTAAGVAWPIFGIIFWSLGIAVGGISAIIIGSVATILFLIIATSITYWSYKEYLQEKTRFQDKMKDQDNKILQLVYSYLLKTLKESLLLNRKYKNNAFILVEVLKEIIQQDIIKSESEIKSPHLLCILHRLLDDQQNNNILHNLTNIYNNNELIVNDVDRTLNTNLNNNNHLKKLKNNICDLCTQSKDFLFFSDPPIKTLIKAGCIGFAAAFGSVAGCISGMIGLAGGLGIFAGLTVFPIVGWATLFIAIIFGLIVSGINMHNLTIKTYREQLIHYNTHALSDLETITRVKHNQLRQKLKLHNKNRKNLNLYLHNNHDQRTNSTLTRNKINKNSSLSRCQLTGLDLQFFRPNHPQTHANSTYARSLKSNLETTAKHNHKA